MTPESPIQLKPGRGGSLKIKRGGTGKISNSGNERKRFHTPVRAIRNVQGQHLPWPPRGKPIWDPTDPFIIAYQQEHPRHIAAWRTEPRVVVYRPKVTIDIETRDGI